jgi:two-component system NtrC family sensor kinase
MSAPPADHAQKLQALGLLISGVAHELANPLTTIVARAAMIARAATLEDAQRHARTIEAQADRVTRIVRNLSSFARRRPQTRAAISLNEVVRAVAELHGYHLAAQHIQLVLALVPDLHPVEGDLHELEQVLLNLVMNAQHAMAEAHGRGTLTIRTTNGEEVVRLAVEDDGPGIPPERLERIFEPFFSTKGEQGTGLGLAIVRDLVKHHGGRIRVESQVGAGTRMVVELPRFRAPAAPDPELDAAGRRPGVRGILLVVDDEPDIAEMVADLVRARGYEAEHVVSAAAALARLRTGEFRGVLTDLRMPAMDGAQFWEVLRRDHPDLARRTIFMTGNHAEPETAALLESTGQPCLPKPFESEELDAALRTLDPAPDPTGD